MPWDVGQCAGCPPSEPWCVTVEGTGEIVGCHKTKQDAADQVAALNANEAGTVQVEAADEIEASRAAELSDIEEAMGLFADAYRARMAEADSLGLIAPIWAELTFELLAAPFAREATAQTIAVAVASGADPGSIPQAAADQLAHQHLAGFAEYGNLLASVVASAQQKALTAAGQTRQQWQATAWYLERKALAAAGAEDDPALEIAAAGIGTAAVVDPYLTEQRLGILSERTTVGLRNGATNLAMNTAQSLLPSAKRETLSQALRPPPPTGTEAAGSPFDRFKRWLTVLDSRVRRAHSRAHGQTTPTSGVFIIGGSVALYPGDPTLPAKLRVNCRCFIVPADADEATWVERVQGLRAQVACAGTTTSSGGCELPGVGGLAGSDIETTGDTPPTTLEQQILDQVTSGRGRRVSPSDLVQSVELGVTSNATAAFLIEGPDHTDGIMVAVRPRPEEAEALAMTDGLPADELHLTLGFFGTVQDLDDPTRDELATWFRQWAENLDVFGERLDGEVSTVAVFEANESRPLVAIPDVENLGRLRASMVATLEARQDETGVPVADLLSGEHDFQPHITLGYDPTDADMEAALERVSQSVTVDAVELVIGTDVFVRRLGQQHDEPEEQSMRAVRAAPPTVADVVVELIEELAADLADLEEGTPVLVDGIDGLAGIVQETITEGLLTGLDGEDREATENEPLVVIQLVVFDEEAGEWTPQDALIGISADEVTMVDELPMPDTEPEPEEEPEPDEEDAAALAPPADDPDETLNTERAATGDFDWEGVLVPEGVESGDRRVIAEGALTWRDLPLTLMAQFQNPETGGHALAVPAGSIWEIDRVGTVVVGRGFFDSGQAGDELRRMMDEGTMKGVSVDIDMVTSEMIDDGDAEIPLMVLLDGRIMGATATAFPAFQEAILTLVEIDGDQASALVASGQSAWVIDDRYYTTSDNAPDREST